MNTENQPSILTAMSTSPYTPHSSTDDLLRWFISQNIPFHALSSPYFRRLWGKLSKEPLPTRRKLAGEHLDALFSTVSDDIKKALADCDHYSLTTDGWTGLQSSFWSITVTTITTDWKYVHKRLGCIPIFAPLHSANVLATQIKEVMIKLGLDPSKVSSVTTDEGGAAPLIASSFPGADEIHCAAHLLSTTLRRAFDQITEELPWVGFALACCWELASICNRSVVLREKLTVNQIQFDEPIRTLKQSVPTRWNSVMSNLKSVADCKQSIKSFLGARLKEIPMAHWILREDEYFFGIIDRLIGLLGFFDIMTRDVCVETRPTSQFIVQRYLILQRKLESFESLPDLNDSRESREAIRCAQIIGMHLRRKFEPFSDAELMSFVLDPSNRPFHGTTEFVNRWNTFLSDGYDLLKSHMEPIAKINVTEEKQNQNSETTATETRNMYFSFVLPEMMFKPYVQHSDVLKDMIDAELNRFKAIEINPTSSTNFDLISWWRSNHLSYPILSRLARRYLAIPASQAASERDFSRMRLLCTHLRSRLDPWRAWKISVIAPAIYKQDRQEHITSTKCAQTSDPESRRMALKRRYSLITPDPRAYQLSALIDDDTKEDSFTDAMESRKYDDLEFECDSEEEDDHEFDSSISEDVDEMEFFAPGRKYVAASADSSKTTRNSGTKCEIKLKPQGSYCYTAIFNEFPHPYSAPPAPERLFGASFKFIANWTRIDDRVYSFSANALAKKSWTSAKTLLRDVFHEIIPIDASMYAENMEL